jgi:hypothetical protein
MDNLAKELHRPIKRVKKFRKVISYYKNEIWSADLVDMLKFSDINSGYKYILTMIDVYSRYSFAIPLKTKTGKEMVKALEPLFKQYKPENLWVDEGTEFYNQDMKKLLDKYNINIYSTYGEHKAAMIERFNKTLKSKMFKRFTLNGNRKWINILDDLINIYNNTIHRSINDKPINIFNNENIIKNNMVDNRKKTKPIFKINDRVRISYKRMPFDKGYLPNWSYQIYHIDKVLDTIPPTYIIRDEKNEIIKGSFYENELQKTKQKDDVYLVEKILKTRKRKGKTEHFVKWIGYDETYNSWVDSKEIVHDLKDIDKL